MFLMLGIGQRLCPKYVIARPQAAAIRTPTPPNEITLDATAVPMIQAVGHRKVKKVEQVGEKVGHAVSSAMMTMWVLCGKPEMYTSLSVLVTTVAFVCTSVIFTFFTVE